MYDFLLLAIFFHSFCFIETIKLNADLIVSQLIEAAKQLSPKDRLKVNDAIWTENRAIPVAYQRIVLNRMAKARLINYYVLAIFFVSFLLKNSEKTNTGSSPDSIKLVKDHKQSFVNL